MKKIFATSICLLLSACYSYEPKVNTVQDKPDEITVTPPNCPDYSEAMGANWNNSHHSNYGCATATNMGAMATNPHDLIKGRGRDADAERSRLAVGAYNSGAPAGGASASSGSGGSESSGASSGEAAQ